MKQFEYTREFTSDGHVVSQTDGLYVTRAECERRVAEAIENAHKQSEQQAARALQDIAGNLNPVVPALTSIAGGLRREAVELAMAAAQTIGGAALDDNIAARATEALTEAVTGLRNCPELIVSVPEDMNEAIRYHLEKLVRSGVRFTFRIEPHPTDGPGQWRIHWDGGDVVFDRDRAVQAVREAVENHMSTPPDIQADLFGSAGA